MFAVRAVENFLGGKSNDDRISSGVTIFNKECSESMKTIWTNYFVLEKVKPAGHIGSPPFGVRFKMKKAANVVTSAAKKLLIIRPGWARNKLN